MVDRAGGCGSVLLHTFVGLLSVRLGWSSFFGSIMCRFRAWFSVLGGRNVIFVPANAISMMQISLDIPHSCGWFVGGKLGLGLCMY